MKLVRLMCLLTSLTGFSFEIGVIVACFYGDERFDMEGARILA